MLKRLFAVGLVVALIQAQYLHAQTPAATPTPEAVKLKEKVAKWGVGKKVTVKMLDGNSYKGPITRISADDFVVFDQARSRDVPTAYGAVKSASAPRSALFKVGVVVGIFFLVAIIGCAANPDACADSR
jgi:hypothetical protein